MPAPHPDEVKQRVKGLLSSGVSVREAAATGGVSIKTAARWSTQLRKDRSSSLVSQIAGDVGEVTKLRRENQLLRQLVATLIGEQQ